MEHSHSQKPEKNLIYLHEKRPEWGHALFVNQQEDKQTYQFEDGKVRVFKRAYCGYLKPVDAPADQTARTLARLGAHVQAHQVTKATREQSALPFDAQVDYFRSLYPNGFSGTKWKKAKRGFDAKRRLKRHRNPAIQDVQKLLGEVQLSSALARGEAMTLVNELVSALEANNLLTKRQLSGLHSVDEAGARSIISALKGVLYDEPEALQVAFERWLTALSHATNSSPSFELATAPLALAQPSRHVCIRRASFARQASWMSPRLASERRVSGVVYLRWLDMVDRISAELREQGLVPQDHLDVYDFIVDTMKPKAIEAAKALAEERENGTAVPELEDAESMSA
jgi:hypothetical protein